MEVEEKYDLGAEDMAEGFGNEGDGEVEATEEADMGGDDQYGGLD
jgi:hypothetical protein